MKINYVEGNLFKIIGNIIEPAIIPHVCNNMGAFGAGFALQVKNNYPTVAENYFFWYTNPYSTPRFELGNTQFVKVNKTITFANMIAQDSVKSINNPKPIKYKALANCMQAVAEKAEKNDFQIIAPMFGSQLAGGNWKFIEELISELWYNFNVTIVEYKKEIICPQS